VELSGEGSSSTSLPIVPLSASCTLRQIHLPMTMSQRTIPYLVAGITGILSGVYIFKPLLDQHAQGGMLRSQEGQKNAPPNPTLPVKNENINHGTNVENNSTQST